MLQKKLNVKKTERVIVLIKLIFENSGERKDRNAEEKKNGEEDTKGVGGTVRLKNIEWA